MENKKPLDWRAIITTGIAVSTIILTIKVKSSDAPNVLINMFGISKASLNNRNI